MKIFLQELTNQETEYDFTEDDAWVVEAVARVDETPASSAAARPIEFSLRIEKVDEVAVLNGQIKTRVQALCSRCTVPFLVDCDVSFASLFCNDPELAGVGHLLDSGKPAGQIGGYARHAHSTEKDLDITYIQNDCIDLADVLAEQLRLEVPFQPLCRENCKGMCPQCGADLNAGQHAEGCQARASLKEGPFSALASFNVKN